MSEPLESILSNSQIPHQPYLLITDTPVFSGLPILRELLRRSTERAAPTLLVAARYDPSTLLPKNSSASVIDLTNSIPEFSSEETEEDLHECILSAYTALPNGAQVCIDDIDLLATDYSRSFAINLIRALLKSIKASKAPARLTLLLPHTSPNQTTLLSPTLSPSLTLLHPHHPNLITSLSKSYLLKVEASPHFWQVLETAKNRRTGEEMAFQGLEGVEVCPDWVYSRAGPGPSSGSGAVVQVLVRKSTGGVKGITRSLSALTPTPSHPSSSTGSLSSAAPDQSMHLSSTPISNLIPINPITTPSPSSDPYKNRIPNLKPPETHTDLQLPFNLSLTDDQRRKRAEVGIPYAHEGEGVGEDLDWDWEEDEDDEEV